MNLAGKLLIAMPGMGDPRFAQSVIFVCAHSAEGAMGLIVNKPAEKLKFGQLLTQLGITPAQRARDIRIHIGGPVEHGRGFVLHSSDYTAQGSTLTVDSHFGMTATLDVLQALAEGAGPANSLLALGYAGWGAGQLEREFAQNGWMVCPADDYLLFGSQLQGKWEYAIRKLGINPAQLSRDSGRA